MNVKKSNRRIVIDAFVDENWPDGGVLLFGDAEGSCYDEGFLGIGFQQHGPVAVYDREKCIEALANEFAEGVEPHVDPYSEAVEWFDYNTAGSWVGEQTPIIITALPVE